MVAYTILDAHGYEIIASDEQIKAFLVELATKEKQISEIIEWIERNTKRLKYQTTKFLNSMCERGGVNDRDD
jgi:prophage maintenance system killer protein